MVRSTVNFRKLEGKIKAGMGLYADTAAKKLERKAKVDRKWTDRTSQARNSLKGSSSWNKQGLLGFKKGNDITINLSGGMPYSPALELAYEKRYAVITPTVQAMSAEILSGFAKVVGQ